MPLPGLEVQTSDQSAPRGPSLGLSTPFIVGELERGPETPVAVRSLRDLQRLCGARNAYSAPTHDWLDAFWHEGGGVAYVLPLRGPAAATASHAFVDSGAATAITVAAKEPGAWANGAANGLSADIDVTGTDFEVKVYLDGVLVERSGLLADGAAAAAWSENSRYVTIADGPGGDPVATGAPANLTGGDDDYDGITVTEIGAAFALFPARYGAGTGVLPGRTDSASQLAAAAALATPYHGNRLLKADLTTDDAATVAAGAVADLRDSAYADIIDPLVGRLTIPGLADGTARTVPLSALRCACEARNERAGLSPNQPAAGRWGVAQWATGIDREWTDDERETLNDAGANVAILDNDGVKLFGARTASDPATSPAAIRLGSARLRAQVVEIARTEGGAINFAEIDQGGVELGNLAGRISGRIRLYERSLYYLDVDAYVVEDEVNPGQYLVEVAVEFQAAPDAERVRAVIQRAVTEV